MNIRFRNIKRDSGNVIVSGSATLVENSYTANPTGNRLKNHTRQKVIEPLGRVIWVDENDNTVGIFDSPTRGLVFYDLKKDEFTPVDTNDPRLAGTRYQFEPIRIHTSFGNTYLFFSEMEKTPYMDVLRTAFPDCKLYQRVLAHLAHDCLKNGSSIKCGEFLAENWMSYLLKDISLSTLDCDSSYFAELADDNHKRAFFQALVQEMRNTNPKFGQACYVDSTPLPGEAENNPFNALCSHGTDGVVIQSRLVLVLDIETCVPIWYEIIPSNVLDKSTILSITEDVKATLEIDIVTYDLDAGYARKELFELFNRDNSVILQDEETSLEHTLLVRMPAIQGYPKDELYIQCKPHFYNGRFSFDYEHHTFFGERKEIDLFGYPEYAFVYIDKTQAESLLRGWRAEHLEEWNELTDSAQDWYQVKDGFFVLIGNKDQTPIEALREYRGRTHIETFFRDGKAYLKILPLAKWEKRTVKGKIFHDIIETIFYRAYRKQVTSTGLSMSSLIVYLDSWECFLKGEDLLELKTPRTQVRELMEKLGYNIPGRLSLTELGKELFEGIPMDREPVTMRRKRNVVKPPVPISPEEKLASWRQEQTKRLITAAEQKKNKAISKAESNLKKTTAKAEAKEKRATGRAQKELDKKLVGLKRESAKTKAKELYEQALAIAHETRKREVEAAEAAYAQAKSEAERIFEQEKADAQKAFAHY